MKNFILLLCLIVSQLAISQQVDFNKKKTYLTMDNEVIPVIEEFIEEVQKRGFYLRFFLMEKVDNIFFIKDFGMGEDPRLGSVGADYRSIYLSPKLKNSPILLKVTIFHEIGHIIKFNIVMIL